MAFPTLTGNVSVTSTTAATISKTPAGHVADDIFLLLVGTVNRQPATPSGWTLLGFRGTGTAGAAGSTGLTIFGKRAASGAEPAVVTSNPAPGEVILAGLLQFRGVPRTLPLASLVVTGGVLALASTAVSWPDAGSTTSDDSLIVQAVSNATLTTTPQGSGYTNAALAAITERQDVNTNIGVGGGITDITAELHIAGPVGVTTAVLATSSAQALLSVILPSQSNGPSAAFLAQVADMLTKGAPFEIDGVVYSTVPTLDTDCLVFTQTVPALPGVAAGTTLRAVLNLAAVERMRSKNA
jgi:hypothetical protein